LGGYWIYILIFAGGFMIGNKKSEMSESELKLREEELKIEQQKAKNEGLAMENENLRIVQRLTFEGVEVNDYVKAIKDARAKGYETCKD